MSPPARRLVDPEGASVSDLLAVPAAGPLAGRTAVTLLGRRGAAHTLTFADLAGRAERAAARLVADGLAPDGRVLVVLPTGLEFLDTFFGVLAAGGVPVPVAPPMATGEAYLAAWERRVAGIAADSGATHAVAAGRVRLLLRPSVAQAAPGLRLVGPGLAARALATRVTRGPDDLALLQYTSGTTGEPKGVALTHRNILANAASIERAIDPEPGEVTVSWLPLYHDMGLLGTLVTTLYGQVPLVLMAPKDFLRDPLAWLRAISDHRGTITAAPNFAFRVCVRRFDAHACEGLDLSSLRIALNGAEPVDLPSVERFHATFAPFGLREHVVRPVYGLAEATLAVTFSDPGACRVDAVDRDRLEREGAAVPAEGAARPAVQVGVGRPLEGHDVRVVDEDGRVQPERRVGQILVRGPSVMSGYHGRPAATGEVLASGWLATGDAGYLADGHLFVVGRTKDLIIRHGRNVQPQDLEAVAGEVPGVRTGACAAFAVDEGGAAPRVIVVAETRLADPAERARASQGVRDAIAAALLFPPDEVHLVAPGAIPRTTSGKIRRGACAEALAAGALDSDGRPGGAGDRVRRAARTGAAWLRSTVGPAG